MKISRGKEIIKKFIATAMGVVVLLTSNLAVSALTSDQVELSVTKPGAGYVATTSSSLRVRAEANTSSTVLAALPSGSMIMIVERCGDFYKVQYDIYGHYGYVADQYIREYDLECYRVVKTSGSTLNVRADRDSTSTKVATIPNGRAVPVLNRSTTWDYILYGNVSGYVLNQYTELEYYE
ncbi:MAG: SH3 domain-containing protein [Lachnospiraceae bacterium]|nr:SH3 domain-containing protein [Lachnospiraceae bacterium]